MSKCAKCHRGRGVLLMYREGADQYHLGPWPNAHGVYLCNGCARQEQERMVEATREQPRESAPAQ